MKNTSILRLLFVSLALLPVTIFGQITVTNGYTAQQLGNNLAGNNINVFNASISGNAQQYGQFQYVGADLGLNSGVILSTGNIFDAVGPNNSSSTSSGYGGPGNTDLSTLAGFSTHDAVVFNFDFEVQGDEIEFNFVFLSEEYNEFVNSGFNDVFAFYISGPGIVGQQNLAVVPGTTTPVTINSINNNSFWQFYNDNEDNGTNIEYDGYTTLMTATKSGLQPCGVYTLSLRIADGSDGALDSGVLLQENSLVQTNVSASSNTFSGNNTALEGCIEASFTFAIDSALSYDITIPIGIGGTATNGVDYDFVDNVITIPAGQLSSTLIIDAVADGLTEGQEVVELYFTPTPCDPMDTVLLFIDDYTPLEYNITPTDVSCFGLDNGQVDLSVTGGISPYTLTLTDSLTGSVDTYTTFPVTGLEPGTYYVEVIDGYGCTAADIIAGNIFDAGTTFIPDGMGGSYSSTINLGGFGAAQTIQSADQIQSICATMEHSRIGELEITLTAPNGQVVTLKEQPGGSVTNMGEPCAVGPTDGGNSNTDPGIGYNYCWQAQSTYLTMVDESNSYTYSYTNICDGSTQNDKYLPTGSYQPYESFNNFIGAPLNGGWTITVTDHIPNNNGYIFDWSIVLQADPPDSVFTIVEPVGPTFTNTTVQPACGANTGSIDLTVTGGTGPFSYLWSNGQTTQDISGLTAGIYTVTVTDGTSCNYSYQVNLANTGTLAVTGVVTNQTCAGLNNGSINVTVSGGTNPITYSWNSGQITEDLSNLSPGTYTVTVQDGGNCQGIATFTVTAAPTINISSTITNESCGDQEGIIDITVIGAVAPVSYSWSNGATTEDNTELQQGTYTVNLLDANNCSATGTYSVINLVGNCVPDCDLAITSETVTNESCGNSNGSINLSVFTTNGPMQYSWSNGAVTEDLFNLVAGTYTVSITDNLTCVVTQTYTVTNQSGTLAITGINTTNENCGNGQGAADASVSGGVQPYSYSWSNGATTQDLSGISAGPYTLTVTDASGCSVNQSITIQNISGTLTQTYGNAVNEICSNGAGSIDIQLTGGQIPYSYAWSNGATSQDLLGLSAGTYSAVITDANGCSISTPVYTVANQSGTLAFSNIDVDNEVCSNNLGDIAISVTGGVSPYTYLWNTGATTQNLGNLSAGTYSLTVTDDGGCAISTGNLTVLNESGTLSLTGVSTFDELCGNGTGSINVSVTGGTAPLSFSWNTGSTSQDLTNLSAGNYTCTITDVNSCLVQVSATVSNDPGILTVDNMIITNETCGQSNGAINLILSGAAAPVTYSWSNGALTQDLSGISAGNYTVQITDNNGCATSGTSTLLNVTNGLTVSSSSVVSEICGGSNGSIDITVNGGTAPLTYSWSTGQLTEDISGLSAGTYSCTVTDNGGCEVVAGPFTLVNSSGTLSAVLTSSTNETCGNDAGAIDVTVTGGAAPYIYSWSNGASTEDLTGLQAGTYTLNVTDQNGCVDQVSATITNLPGTLAFGPLSITDETCNNNQGAINISVSGGTPAYTYLWSNGAVTQDLSALSEGTFSLTVSDANGCSINSGSLTVNNNSGNFDVTGINVTNEICGDDSGYIDLIVSGAALPVTYLWSNGATTQDLSSLSAGSFPGTAVDNAGCTISFSATVFNESGTLAANSVVTAATCYNSNGAIALTVTGGQAPLTYLWSTGATTEDISGLAAGNYTVNITDASGCYLNYSVAVGESGGPSISSVTITDETCGNTDGSITVGISNGTAPYTYSWSGGASNPCCNYTLAMHDLGNTWNGAFITVLVNGSSMGNFTVTGGGEGTGTFAICTGDALQLNWSSGTFDNEVSFELLDGSGNIVYSHGGNPPVGTLFTGTGNCSAGPMTGNSLTNLGAGTYSVTVTDANGCQDSTTMIVNNSSGTLQVDLVNLENETCSDANGSIDLSLNGNPPFTYSWNTGATTEDLTGLSAGTYTFTITDQSGCSAVETFTITNTTFGLVLASSTITDETCGDQTGAIAITASGGAGILSYQWNNGFTAQNISGLSAGTYTVTISDGSVCDLVESFTVGNQTGGFIVTGVPSIETCGTSNGAINVIISGGTSPFTYLWSNGETTEDLTGLSAGTYTLTVTDGTGCSFTQTYTVNGTNGGLTLTATVTDDDCEDGVGAINLSVSGGQTPYSYSWSNGGNTQDQNNLNSGTYTVIVTGNNGCTASASYNVESTGTFNLSSVAIVDEICNNGDGSINLTFTGPGQPNQYNWSNGGTTQDISNLSTGWYVVEMSNPFGPGGGCMVIDSFFVDQYQGTLSLDSILVVNESCSQGNGSLNAYISGGSAPLTYLWSNGEVTEDISLLSTGSYTLTVTDANGCSASQTEGIANYTYGFGVSAAIVDDEFCGDASGSINVTVSGGTPGYTYSWATGESTEDLSGLAAGTYVLTVTDANGCSVTNSFTVQNITNGFAVSSTVTDETCGNLNGMIDLTVSGGIAPITFDWSNSAVSEDLTGLTAGTFSCVITDGSGCELNVNETVNSYSANFDIGTAVIVDEVCGDQTGSITLNPTGGTAPLTYSWDLPDPCCSYTLNMYDLNNNGWGGTPAPGVIVYVNGVAFGPFMVPVGTGNSFATESISVCTGDVIDVEYVAAAQNTNNTYEILDAAGNIIFSDGPDPLAGIAFSTNAACSAQNVNSLTGLSAGDYPVTTTDLYGCTVSDTFTVNNITGDFAVAGIVTNTNCNGADGTIDLTSTGGAGSYIYNWSTTETTEDISSLSAGDYDVAITDGAGCIINQSYTVQNTGINIDYLGASVTNATCATCTDGAIDISLGGAASPYTFSWSNSASTEDVTALVPGSYSITITNADGCDTIIGFVVLNTASLIELSETSVNVIPNPSDGNIILMHANLNCGKTNLKVMDAAGRIVYRSIIHIEANSSNHTLDLSNLAPGTYVLAMEADGIMINKRLVIR